MRTFSLALLMASSITALAACDDAATHATDTAITISITQSLTGQTTAAGTFKMSGAQSDTGSTQEDLVFGGPLTTSPVPLTFTRVLTGKGGTMTLRGSASLAFTSQTEAGITGTWTIAGGTGRYANASGSGTFIGNANFGTTPPGATIKFTGLLTGAQ